MTKIAYYSMNAVLSPGETATIPGDEHTDEAHVVFDRWDTGEHAFDPLGMNAHLMLVLRVHESELLFAREHGSAELITRLKKAGEYPYSDPNRAPVV